MKYRYAPKQPKYRVTGYVVIYDYEKPGKVVATQAEAEKAINGGGSLSYTEQRTPLT